MTNVCYALLLSILFLVIKADQQPLTTPQSFALITVTHTRGNNYLNIQKHIDKYATMDCPIVSEMNIVWNNEINPEKAPIYNKKSSWKRPVYFYKTPNNSMDWRYKIPSQSKAQVFFIIDDDVGIDCTQLKRGFKKWQQNAIGSIGPILTYAVRFFEYTQQNGFLYGRVKQRDMFSLGLVGLSFMSRHFMDLYYADIQLIQEMRKIVRQKNNCDDIGINWLIQYFYPELQTVYLQAVKGNLLANSPAIAQSTSPNHYPYRSQCILLFTKLFGINALRYKPINDNYQRKQIRIIPLKAESILNKKRFLQGIIKGNNVDETNKQGDQVKQQPSQQIKQKQEKQLQYRQSVHNPGKYETSSQSLSVEQVLLLCVVILVLMVIFLIYLLFKMIKEKKLLLMKHNQMNAIQSSREAISQE